MYGQQQAGGIKSTDELLAKTRQTISSWEPQDVSVAPCWTLPSSGISAEIDAVAGGGYRGAPSLSSSGNGGQMPFVQDDPRVQQMFSRVKTPRNTAAAGAGLDASADGLTLKSLDGLPSSIFASSDLLRTSAESHGGMLYSATDTSTFTHEQQTQHHQPRTSADMGQFATTDGSDVGALLWTNDGHIVRNNTSSKQQAPRGVMGRSGGSTTESADWSSSSTRTKQKGPNMPLASLHKGRTSIGMMTDSGDSVLSLVDSVDLIALDDVLDEIFQVEGMPRGNSVDLGLSPRAR